MPRAAARDRIYYRRRYNPETIELCVRWYLAYRLSYRDLTAMMAERDVAVSSYRGWMTKNKAGCSGAAVPKLIPMVYPVLPNPLSPTAKLSCGVR